jgi:DNA-binding MarR family transcriptional regulator
MSETLIELRRMIAAVDELRSIYPDVPATTITAFLVIATTPGISSQHLKARLGVSQSATSRHLALLSEFSWNNQPGLNLVDSIEDPEDRRNKIAFLTAKGRGVATKLASVLRPDLVAPDPSLFPTAQDHIRRYRSGAR